MNENETRQPIESGGLPVSRPNRDLDLSETVLRMIDGLPIPPADQRNDLGGLALYRAVSAVRIAMRRRDTQPGELARAAGLLYGLPADSILRLAVEAEDGCQRARAALR